MPEENGQAGALGGIVDQSFELIDRVGHDSRDLRKRWDNRLVLKGRSTAEAYVNGDCGVVVYGDWGDGIEDYQDVQWACSITSADVVDHLKPCISGIDPCNFGDGNGRDEQIMFVVVVEVIEPPQRLVRSVLRPYLFKKRFLSAGDGFLYQRQRRGGFEVLPFGMNGEMLLHTWPNGSAYPRRQMIKGGAQIMDGIPDDQREKFWDRLHRAIVGGKSPLVEIGKEGVVVRSDFVEIAGKGLGDGAQLIDVAVGPFNL